MKNSELWFVDIHGRVWTCKPYDGPAPVLTDHWRRAEVGSGRYQIRYKDRLLVYAARLVWFWFNGPIPEDHEIDHINNDKLDNSPENLQTLSRYENQLKAEYDGLVDPARYPSDARKIAMQKWWDEPGRREIMSQAACAGWQTRRSRHG
jgi:hypothetical protein